jgi:hypothetical protein
MKLGVRKTLAIEFEEGVSRDGKVESVWGASEAFEFEGDDLTGASKGI